MTFRLVYFENGIPSMYHGDLTKEDQVLAWLIEQLESDEIEEVTNEMLNMLVQNNQQLAVLFCKFIFSATLITELFLLY